VKTLGSVRHQLKQVSFRHLKKQLEDALRPRPANCVFNAVVAHPTLIATDKGPCSLCIHPDQEADRLCDIAWGGVEKAKGCPLFLAKQSKDEIKDEFREWLSTATLAEVAAEYPDMAALLWVLQEEAPNREVEIADDEDWQPELETEEEYLVEFAGLSLRFSAAEDAEAFNSEVGGMQLALTTANKQFSSASKDLTQVQADVLQLQSDLEAKTEDHQHVSSQVTALRMEATGLKQQVTDQQATIQVQPVSWWRSLFGGGS
jgi:hypothetical protein